MALTTIISNTQQRVKDSYASSATVGLCLRSNGEELPKVIDSNGNVFSAGFTPPTVAPTVADNGAGNLTNGKWVVYGYTYASSLFPFVETDNSINGQLFPTSNVSVLSTAFQIGITGGVHAGNRQLLITLTKTTNNAIDIIWVFRTALFATQLEAETAAQAGQIFFSRQLVNDQIAGTISFTDNTLIDGVDQISSDNFVAPQFQFCVFYDPYWWGFGNLPFKDLATWDNSNAGATGKITLSGTATWFNGRNGQVITLEGITTGGFNGAGAFKFLWLTSTTATVTIDGVTPVALPATNATPKNVTIQGVATTLFRSKARNPFSWGFTDTIGDANVPQLYAFKVGGGLGTALAVVPNNPTLKMDTELPAKSFTLNLRAAGTSSFEGTLRIISDVYSMTSHFCQFPGIDAHGNTVLMGIDFKNFAILQSDGVTQTPISGPIPKILRALTTDRTRQLLSHGVYDPQTELNCFWVCSSNSLSLINYLIYNHAPTGFWGFSNELDLLSSATIEDTLSGAKKTFVGTQTGIFGQALVDQAWSNWVPSTGDFTGAITSATGTTITSAATFNTTDDGIIGNWCLVTDPSGQQEQWARISARSTHTLTFDWIRSLIGGGTTAFNPIPAAGWKFFIGLIECELVKYFDFNLPQSDKRLMELWLTQQNVDTTTQGTLIRFYRERENTYQQFAPLQSVYQDDGGSDTWYQKQEIPSELVKSLGLKFINRGYQQWRFINLVLKPNVAP